MVTLPGTVTSSSNAIEPTSLETSPELLPEKYGIRPDSSNRKHGSRSLSPLEEAIEEFHRNYEQFAKKNSDYFIIDEDLNAAYRVFRKSKCIFEPLKLLYMSILSKI